ncbi:zinc finger and BTB domain-containing protein 1 [Mobula hypostoma]|uniref:zinc finger and BTB domain-containing protein 1 n=1 Tax=Mobula hypostoma TaxID=723540 RepID=UPI002FC2D06D
MARPSHSEYVLQQLNNQREWGFLCDCCIIIGDIYFRAHRAVLTACSSYFRMLFIGQQQLTGDLSLSQAPVTAECFDLILQLMYLGRLVGVPSDFEELRSAMTFLQLYYVPRSLEEVREDSAPSPPFGPPRGSMLFGVRMHGLLPGDGKVPRAGPKDQAGDSELNGMREAAAVADASPDRPSRKPSRGNGLKGGRLHRRFGRRYTCDRCGFVFSCERLLDEHSLTCDSRRALPQPGDPPPARGRGTLTLDTMATAGEGGGEGEADCTRPEVKTEPEDTAATNLGDLTVVQVAAEGELTPGLEEDLSPPYSHFGQPPPPERDPGSWTDEEEEDEEEDGGLKEEDEGAGAGGSPLGPACELCGVALPESERAEHYVAHHRESVCACGKCGRVLVKGGRLQEHAERCLGTGEQGLGLEQPPEEACACPVCGQAFPASWQLEEHMQEHQVAEETVGVTPDATYRCPHCPLAFEEERPWAEHMARCGPSPPGPEGGSSPRRRHVCQLCGRGFYQRCHLREHQATHTREREFTCPLCGKSFLRERLLRLHLDMHRGEARYVCPCCGQGSYRKQEHLRHLASHLVAGQALCEVCFQVQADGRMLERHMQLHMHTCPQCGDRFKLKKDLSTHQLTSHTKRA